MMFSSITPKNAYLSPNDTSPSIYRRQLPWVRLVLGGEGQDQIPVQSELGLSGDHIEVLLSEGAVLHLHPGGRVVTHVEEVVPHHYVHPLH